MKEVDSIVKELKNTGATKEQQKAAKEAAKQVKSFANVYDDLIDEIAGQTDPKVVEELIKDKLDFADDSVRKAIIESLQKGISEGARLDLEFVTNSFTPLVESNKQYVETLNATSEGNQAAFDANSAALERNRKRIEEEAQKERA